MTLVFEKDELHLSLFARHEMQKTTHGNAVKINSSAKSSRKQRECPTRNVCTVIIASIANNTTPMPGLTFRRLLGAVRLWEAT